MLPALPLLGPGHDDVVSGRDPTEPASDRDSLRQRSMLASEALSELSRLSTYSPSAAEGRGGPAPLTRRPPAVGEAPKVRTPASPAPARRQRSAADVRSMLSGFQSDDTRGGGADAGTTPPSTQDGEP